jgi:hypothetical protein
MSISNQALLEISELQNKAERLSRGSASDRAQATMLLGRIKNIRTLGISSDEMRSKYAAALGEEIGLGRSKPSDAEYRSLFDKYISGKIQSDGPELLEETRSSIPSGKPLASGIPSDSRFLLSVDWRGTGTHFTGNPCRFRRSTQHYLLC